MTSIYLYKIYKDGELVLRQAEYRQAIEFLGKEKGFKLSCYAKNGELINGYKVEFDTRDVFFSESEIEAIKTKAKKQEEFNRLWNRLKKGDLIYLKESGYDAQYDTQTKWLAYKVVQKVGDIHIALQRTTNPRRTDYTRHAMWEFFIRGGIK